MKFLKIPRTPQHNKHIITHEDFYADHDKLTQWENIIRRKIISGFFFGLAVGSILSAAATIALILFITWSKVLLPA